MRWPRKNDAASIRARQELTGIAGLPTELSLEAFTGAAEALTGVAVIPVSVCPVELELGSYELSPEGEPLERTRAVETVHVPLAHTEGSLTLSMTRGATAAGTVRAYVLADRLTRASCFLCADAGAALALAGWIERELPAISAGSSSPRTRRSHAMRGCGRSTPTSSDRCATRSGAGRPATLSART